MQKTLQDYLKEALIELLLKIYDDRESDGQRHQNSQDDHGSSDQDFSVSSHCYLYQVLMFVALGWLESFF